MLSDKFEQGVYMVEKVERSGAGCLTPALGCLVQVAALLVVCGVISAVIFVIYLAVFGL